MHGRCLVNHKVPHLFLAQLLGIACGGFVHHALHIFEFHALHLCRHWIAGDRRLEPRRAVLQIIEGDLPCQMGRFAKGIATYSMPRYSFTTPR